MREQAYDWLGLIHIRFLRWLKAAVVAADQELAKLLYNQWRNVALIPVPIAARVRRARER